MNETQVSLRVDVISNICWKDQLSLSWYERNFLFELLYLEDNLADQINKNGNFSWIRTLQLLFLY